MSLRHYWWLALLCGIIFLLASCSASASGTTAEADALWICTNITFPQEVVSAIFKDQYPGTELKFTDLSPDLTGRISAEAESSQLQSLRTEIMAGRGPDLFLWNTLDSPGDSLFPDLQKSMRAGIFLDLAPLLEARDDWDPDDYQPAVLKAGMVEDSLYLYPLYYKPPTVLLTAETAARLPADVPIFSLDRCGEWTSWAEAQGKALNADYVQADGYWDMMSAPMLDYESRKACLANPLFAKLALIPSQGVSADSLRSFINGDAISFSSHFFRQIYAALFSEEHDVDTVFCPVYSEEGALNACVNLVVGIRRNTQHAQSALDFLMLLLKPYLQAGGEYQWANGDAARETSPLSYAAVPIRVDCLSAWITGLVGRDASSQRCVDSLVSCAKAVTSARLPDACTAEVILALQAAQQQGRSLADVFAELDARWDIYVTE